VPDSKGVIYRRNKMSAVKIIAIVLIIAGLWGLIYGDFSYTREIHEAKPGSYELSVKDTRTVPIPTWVGVGAVLAGGILLYANRKS
jgi:hypothetical protein